VADGFAALTGWLLGAVLLAVALAMGITGLWAPALLLGHGGLLLWAWATWRQHPAPERAD
jgi:hypothetical protein